jgi:hypothetical protein
VAEATVVTRALPDRWLAIVAIAAVVLGHRMSADALHQYAEQVRSAFDLHVGDLAERSGLALPCRVRRRSSEPCGPRPAA